MTTKTRAVHEPHPAPPVNTGVSRDIATETDTGTYIDEDRHRY